MWYCIILRGGTALCYSVGAAAAAVRGEGGKRGEERGGGRKWKIETRKSWIGTSEMRNDRAGKRCRDECVWCVRVMDYIARSRDRSQQSTAYWSPEGGARGVPSETVLSRFAGGTCIRMCVCVYARARALWCVLCVCERASERENWRAAGRAFTLCLPRWCLLARAGIVL